MTAARLACCLAAASLAATGCFKSYVVASFHPEVQPAAPARFQPAPGQEEARARIRKVALRAPASCLAEPAATPGGAGIAARTRTVLETRCQTWLGALERALSTRYEIISWRALAEAERDAGSPGSAGVRVGADAVVLVTDLHAVPVLAGTDRGSVKLLEARPDGREVGPARLSSAAEARIRAVVEDRYRDGAVAGIAASVELVAIDAATGAHLWTFARRLQEDLDGAGDARMLLRGRGSAWRPVLPRGARDAPSPEEADVVQARAARLAAAAAGEVALALERDAPAVAAAVPPAPAEPATRSPAPRGAPAGAPLAVAWHRPTQAADADDALPWNRSVIGAFDPWTRNRLLLLYAASSVDLSFHAASGLRDMETPIGPAKRTYPAGRFSGTYSAARVEWGMLGLEYGAGTGTLSWGDGVSLRASTFTAKASMALGTLFRWDPGRPDVRVGLTMPEPFLRFVGGSFDGSRGTAPAFVGFGALAVGVSAVGLRATLGDLLFLEARAGEFALTQTYADVQGGDGVWDAVLSVHRRTFAVNPTVRVGFAL